MEVADAQEDRQHLPGLDLAVEPAPNDLRLLGAVSAPEGLLTRRVARGLALRLRSLRKPRIVLISTLGAS